MHVVVAPDSWGGWRTAPAIASRIEAALLSAGHTVEPLPLTDGGEGASIVLASAHPARGVTLAVTGPHGQDVRAIALQLDGFTFLESARIIGRAWCSDAATASSVGLGEALGQLDRRQDGPILVGLGGSGTMDGGLGLAQGLGLHVVGGPGLADITSLSGPVPLPGRLLQVWCDVTTPILDSARVYGPQKGADAFTIERTSRGLAHWVDVVNAWRHGHGLPFVPASLPHGGAAGGLGWALHALLGASLRPGADAAARTLDLDATLSMADVVVTGEGRLDATSLAGKVVGTVLSRHDDVRILCGRNDTELSAYATDDFPGATRDQRFDAALAALVASL
ncbi:MAG: glycerate kinase [Proteobacteria bacterium]|nr:glycerate kinase [Pseudomonadota bacterium]MCP4918963.1 glycerate kinase [Pseudomonadota bacterium]